MWQTNKKLVYGSDIFIDLVKKQLKKGLLRDDNELGRKYTLPLPYSRLENTRLTYFPYYKIGDHELRFTGLYRKDMYNKMNEELLEDLRKAMKLKSEPLGSRRIKYITCSNCADSGLIYDNAVEITFTLEAPEEAGTEAGKEEAGTKAGTEEREQAPIQEEAGTEEETEKATEEAREKAGTNELREGGRKSKRRKSTKKRKSKRRKSTKRRKSLK